MNLRVSAQFLLQYDWRINRYFLAETWQYVMNKSRDQDVPVFFSSFRSNLTKRHFLIDKFKEDFDTLFKRLDGNFSLQYLVNVRSPLLIG